MPYKAIRLKGFLVVSAVVVQKLPHQWAGR